MAILKQTEIQVFSDEAATTQVGNTITNVGTETGYYVDGTALGATIDSGEEYWVRLRVKDNNDVYSSWTPTARIVTYPNVGLHLAYAGDGQIVCNANWWLNSNVVTITEWGVAWSYNADGSNPIIVTAEQPNSCDIMGVEGENIDVYVVPWYIDSLGRNYIGDFADAETLTLPWYEPYFYYYNVVADWDRVTGQVQATTNETGGITSLGVWLCDSGFNYLYYYDLLPNQLYQSFSFVDGATDDNGVTISIAENTDYYIVPVADTSSISGAEGEMEIHTSEMPSVTATLNVSNITATSATISLTLVGNSSQQPQIVSYYISKSSPYWQYDIQCDEFYGTQTTVINGLSSGTTYNVYAEATTNEMQTPSTDSFTFTTL